MTHFMFDLETLDTLPTSVVLSIGAVEFDPKAGTVNEKNGLLLFPSIQEQIDSGRTISAETLIWWVGQSDAAKTDWVKRSRKKVGWCCDAVRKWVGTPYPKPKVWGNGAGFDITIMESFFNYTAIPWKFYNIRDTRTLWDIHPYDKDKKGPVAHTALDDAIAQAERVCESWPKAAP